MFKRKVHPFGTKKPISIIYRPWVVTLPYFNYSKVYKSDNTNKWITNKKSSSAQQ